jgi:hypothetical protein
MLYKAKILVFCIVSLSVYLRYVCYPNELSFWTEEGFRFHMCYAYGKGVDIPLTNYRYHQKKEVRVINVTS